MSGIYAVVVKDDDGGVRSDNETLIARSSRRGLNGTRTDLISHYDGSIEEDTKRLNFAIRKDSLLDPSYSFIGAAFNEPAVGAPMRPPAKSETGRWIAVWDGSVAGESVIDKLTLNGPGTLRNLSGNFAILAISTKDPGRIYYATRAKPLYVLFDTLRRCIRVASSRDAFDGMYHPLLSPQPLELGPNRWGHVTVEGSITSYFMNEGKTASGTLLLCGGGLDSLVTAFCDIPQPLTLLHVDYGCRAEAKEWLATQSIASALGARTSLIHMPNVGRSSLDPSGRSVEKNPQAGVASEWVPARNTLLMAIAVSYCEANGIGNIATGINMDAASAYPDNEAEWLNKWQQLIPYAISTTSGGIRLHAPLAGLSKVGIVNLGEVLQIPWRGVMSWSCYEGGEKHCGQCSSCRYRREAFRKADVKDPTSYAR